MPQSMTQNGIAAGKNDRETAGALQAIYDEWNLSTYDPDSDGTGNDFDADAVYGISSVRTFHVYVADGSPYRAVYDHDEGAIRLYDEAAGGEVGNETDVNVDLRVEVRGN